MTEDPSLVLPSPARELWLNSRDVVKAGLERIKRREADYALTGGTVLAARWRHRKSFEESGLNLHFANKQPDALTLRDHARTLARETDRPAVVYREERDAAVHYEPMSN